MGKHKWTMPLIVFWAIHCAPLIFIMWSTVLGHPEFEQRVLGAACLMAMFGAIGIAVSIAAEICRD